MDMDKYIGRLLDGRYEIQEVLGVGGMAVVYKAFCHRLNRYVAIKILKDDYSQDEEFRRRFHAESQAVAMLSHSNIVSVYDVSTSDDADYIVMELIDGITLKQYMGKKGVLNWKETLHFAIQIAKALEHAHSRSIIHRDIKPHNVMVLKNGSVKVTDFGIAQVMSKSNTLTKEALGSVHYISPEQAKGGRVDNRSDIYSLGVVMYEMMTGRPPFDGESPVAVAIQHISGKASMPSALNPNMPGGLEQIIMKAMEQEPQKRFTTATEMLNDMDEFRKDPTMLFDYNNTSTGMDDATLLRPEQPREPVVVPPAKPASAGRPARPAAKKPAGGTQQPQRRPSGSRPPQRRQREEIIEEEENRNWVATIAIVLCAVVAIAAIGIFAFVLMGTDTDPQLVTVPDLVGKKYTSGYVVGAKDIVINQDNFEFVFSDERAVDEIISQNPVAGAMVEPGTEVKLTISLGPKPVVILMKDVIHKAEEDALKTLKNELALTEDRIKVLYEPNDIISSGYVIRTDPAKDQPIAEGQKVTIYVSSGKQVKMAKMPRVIDMKIETAEKLLNINGFFNIIREEVDSNKPSGTVLGQSSREGIEIPLSTVIILQVAKGADAEIVPPDAPKPPETDEVSKIVTIQLPSERLQGYVLTVRKNGQVVAQVSVPAGALSMEVELIGKGKQTYEIWADSTKIDTILVDFAEEVESDE